MVGSNSYEKLKTFKYFGSLLTNENSVHEEMKCIIKQNINIIINTKHLSFQLISNNLKIKIYKTVILPTLKKYGFLH
jgi:hypothetical protein